MPPSAHHSRQGHQMQGHQTSWHRQRSQEKVGFRITNKALEETVENINKTWTFANNIRPMFQINFDNYAIPM